MQKNYNASVVHIAYQITILICFIFSLLGCSRDGEITRLKFSPYTGSKEESTPYVSTGLITANDYKEIAEGAKLEEIAVEKNGYFEPKLKEFYLLVNSIDQSTVRRIKNFLEKNGAVVTYIDDKVGLISFRSSSVVAKNLLESNSERLNKLAIVKDSSLDHPRVVDSNSEDGPKVFSDGTHVKGLSSAEVMNANVLKQYFVDNYGIHVDGSNSTVVVVDTGLDISRTDIFQDRIVSVRSIRKNDRALLKRATIEEIDGKQYLAANILGNKVLIERTSRLMPDRDYYLGYFSEKNFKSNSGRDYYMYDLNQNGSDNDFYSIVAYKNDAGIFEAYINVNDQHSYQGSGDLSIEDENLLIDFEWAAKNISDRYYKDSVHPLKSYYKYTTRMDIAKFESNGSPSRITRDRNKGLVNVAITIAKGFELDDEGNFKEFEEEDGEKYFHIGITGFDVKNHGTHCAGIAVGNFLSAPEYSSAASNAKLIGITYLGQGSDETNFFSLISHVAKFYKNPIFSFSFGSSDAVNNSVDATALALDRFSLLYGIPFVKAAGNDGPGVKSHGVYTSKNIISVANFSSTTSRVTFGTETLVENKFVLTNSSSRGPMVDGLLKPDIGAPGWVLSVVPLARSLKGEQNSFQYFPGTSMSTPNVASIVALLFDAAEKMNLREKNENLITPMSITTLQKIIKNSALKYDTFPSYECLNSFYSNKEKRECVLVKKDENTKWFEGGAGRINAFGAWKIFEELYNKNVSASTFDMALSDNYNVKTTSVYPDYKGDAFGYYTVDSMDDVVTFEISLDRIRSLETLDDHKALILRIPDDVSWASFDVSGKKKERRIDLFASDVQTITLYLDRKILAPEGRLLPGIHSSIIKAYPIDQKNGHVEPYFDFVIPVILQGVHTKFDQFIDDYQMNVTGFIPVEKSANYYIPIQNENDVVLLDLFVDGSFPGDVRMGIYQNGIALDYKLFNKNTSWAISSSKFGDGRSYLRYVLEKLPKGIYEVVLQSDSSADYSYDGEHFGSFYRLKASKIAMDVGDFAVKETNGLVRIEMQNVKTVGTPVRVTEIKTELENLIKHDDVRVKHHENLNYKFDILDGVSKIRIDTQYWGTAKEVDLDLSLLNSSGAVVGGSGNSDSNELIEAELPPGEYTLVLIGYNIPNESQEFSLNIRQQLKKPVSVIKGFYDKNSFVDTNGNASNGTLIQNYFWKKNVSLDLVGVFTKSDLIEFKASGYYPEIVTSIRAKYDNLGNAIPVYLKRNELKDFWK